MEESDRVKYYLTMLNSIRELEDDIVSNQAPEYALELLNELYEVCKSDYNIKYGENDI